jgi:hypothetical protein
MGGGGSNSGGTLATAQAADVSDPAFQADATFEVSA